jgi:hypothetical protein
LPRDGSVTFSDLTGKLDVLKVTCDKCGRAGRYGVAQLIEQHGRDGKLTDWLSTTDRAPADLALVGA